MNVFVAGATGVLGRRIVRQLVERGHPVTGLVRGSRGEQVVASAGGDPRVADLFDAGALARTADGADIVIHAATSIPTKTRTVASDWAMNDRIRREGTRALCQCARVIGAKQLIFESIVWPCASADGSLYDESSPYRPDPTTQSAFDGEQIVNEEAGKSGFLGCVLRCGWFYSGDSAHIKMMGRELKRRRMPILGKGNTLWSNIHVEDAASAFVTAAESGRGSTWHVVDNEPVTMRDFLTTFAAKLAAPAPRKVPISVARLLAGKGAVDFLTHSSRASNARFRREFAWNPRYPTYREGLDEVIAAWGREAQNPST